MLLIDKDYLLSHKDELIAAIKDGAIIIHPTDTIYGIGCDATNTASVQKIREIKQRPDKPLSVMAPSRAWIRDNCIITDPSKLDLLPGPYTLFLTWKNKSPLSPLINPGDDTSVGIRIPKHWFADIVAEAGVPFVTTSVNLSGEKHMEEISDVPQEILDRVDYVIYEGPKKGESSTKIDLR